MKKLFMKRETKLFVFCIVAVVAVLVFAQPQTASADMGPKPSINITFNNLGDETCYATILSLHKSTGPFMAYDSETGYKDLGNFDSKYYWEENYFNEEAEMSWQVFVDYEDEDGFYFLQLWWKVDSEANTIRWGYYPPYTFKVLLYYPESDTFVSSKIYERYAFDSYYTVNMKIADGAQLTLNKSYDYASEVVGLLCRIALTILIELLIALIFRMKGRRVMWTIFIVNAITQIVLNVALNLIFYFDGVLMYLLMYVLFEIGVVIIETVAYCILLRKGGVPIWKSILYAIVANAVTAVLGIFLAKWLPGMF